MSSIITCHHCGELNRVPVTDTARELRCGRCQSSLTPASVRPPALPPPLPPSAGFRRFMAGLALASLLVVGAFWVAGEVRLASKRRGEDARFAAVLQAHETEIHAEVSAEAQQVEVEEGKIGRAHV